MSYLTVTKAVPGDQPGGDTRLRLIAGLSQAIAANGYAGSTIADIVAVARVSKRTFYEHFADKEDCLLALYEHACDHLVAVLREAGSAPGLPWRERVRASTYAYLAAIEAMPAVGRTLLIEMQAAGSRAFALRRRTQERFAEVLRELVEQAQAGEPEVRPLTPALALAIVGGINELLLHAVDPYAPADPGRDPAHPITGLTGPITDLVSAVLTRAP